jgi:predicted  nucleic acid-binding Zn-ribbon protein
LTAPTLPTKINDIMNSPWQLYTLQHIDLELRRNRQQLDEIEIQLTSDEHLAKAKSNIASKKAELGDTEKRQKEAEWVLEDLQQKVKQINDKLYGGKLKNPKELVNLDLESKELGKKVHKKEDELLELMSEVEDIQANIRNISQELEGLTKEWQQKQQMLIQQKSAVEVKLAGLRQDREELAKQISPEALSLYEQIRTTKEQVVAKVERGRCQGCHITLPTTQWQKAKAGNLVQCDSCNRILYVE